MSAMLTVEEGGVCGGRTECLRELYKQGVCMMTLSWNYKNELGHPNLYAELRNSIRAEEPHLTPEEQDYALQKYLNTPDTEHGLTKKGREFVECMEEMGMIVDVSHMSDAGFFDVLQMTKKPFVASHSNARALCPCTRNLTDDMIRALAAKGGVAGLNFCADFLSPCRAGVKIREPLPILCGMLPIWLKSAEKISWDWAVILTALIPMQNCREQTAWTDCLPP